MPTLTGANGRDPGGYAITQLETVLNAALAASPYAADYTGCGGVDAIHDHVTALRYVSSKRPFLFLEVGDLRIGDGLTPGETNWLCEISIEVCTNEATAIYENKLKAALIAILNNSYAALVTAGLEANEIRGGQGHDQKPERICPHTFTCEIFTANQ